MISVIIPTYNRYNKVIEKIRLLDRYQDLFKEVFVIDNYSFDRTPTIKFLKTKCKLVYLRNNANLGLCGNLKKSYEIALEKASSSFVWIISDDDIMLPGLFEKIRTISLQKDNIYFLNHSVSQKGSVSRKGVLQNKLDMYVDLEDIFRKDSTQFLLLGSVIFSKKMLSEMHYTKFKYSHFSTITIPFRVAYFFKKKPLKILEVEQYFINDLTVKSWEKEAKKVFLLYVPFDLLYLALLTYQSSYFLDIFYYFYRKIFQRH